MSGGGIIRCEACGFESEAGMSFCGRCGKQLPAPTAAPDALDSGQRRHLTVLFADVVASTELAERIDPEDFRDLLSDYHSLCSRSTERFGGWVAQFQGDGMISYFGYPRAHEDDAARAVSSGLELLEEVAVLNGELKDRLGVELRVRVGINSGLAVIGDLGSGASMERHAAVGEVLHVAARVQTLARPDSVVITAETLALLRDGFATVALEPTSVKGISHPLAIYEVIRALGEPSAGNAATGGAGARGVIVNRVRERAKLESAWDSARAGRGTVVHVTGEAGIGKSRVVEALRERARADSVTERIARCSAHHTTSVLHPILRLVEQLCEIERDASPEQQLTALDRQLRAAGLEPGGALSALAELLGIAADERVTGGLSPREDRNALLELLVGLLVGDSSAHPLLLVVEDLHWADPTTIELLERIVPYVARLPVACLLTFRTDFEPPWGDLPGISEVDLGPLREEDVRRLVASRGAELDEQSLRRVEEVAEGVPLFVEEMAKLLSERGPSAVPAREPEIPVTIQGLLVERLDRLPELTGVIDVAAVLGKEFERAVAENLSPLDRAGFRSAIAQLTTEEILRPVEGSRSRLEFRHALLQQAAYERMLRRRRRALHGRVADLLASQQTSLSDAEPEQIARHWAAADEPTKALPYWELAGRRALRRAAFLEAAEHFRRGVESLDRAYPPPDQAPLRGEMLTMEAAAIQAGRSPAADIRETIQRAWSAYANVEGRERLIPLLRCQYFFHSARAEYSAAFDDAQQMLALGEEAGREAWLSEGFFYAGLAHMMEGELERARLALEQAVERYERPEREEHVYEAQADPGVSALAYLSTVLWNEGHTERAFEVSEQSLEMAEDNGGPVTRSLAWGMRCALLLVAGKMEEFAQWLTRTREHTQSLNIGYWNTVCAIWSAWYAGLGGDVSGQLPVLRDELARYTAAGGSIGLPHFKALLAELLLASGDKDAAVRELSEAQEHIDATGETLYEPDLQWLIARVLMAGEVADADGATRAYERAMRSARTQDAKLLELRAATGLAMHQRRLGQEPSAMQRVEELIDSFEAGCGAPAVVRARALLAARSLSP